MYKNLYTKILITPRDTIFCNLPGFSTNSTYFGTSPIGLRVMNMCARALELIFS
jgi:hypothetical protein